MPRADHFLPGLLRPSRAVVPVCVANVREIAISAILTDRADDGLVQAHLRVCDAVFTHHRPELPMTIRDYLIGKCSRWSDSPHSSATSRTGGSVVSIPERTAVAAVRAPQRLGAGGQCKGRPRRSIP